MFKQGKFYAIQATDRDGDLIFVEAGSIGSDDHAARLKMIARKASRYSKSYSLMDDEDDDDYGYHAVRSNENPFALRTFPIETDVTLIISHMRHIRKSCGETGINPNSLRIVVVETGVNVYVPESPSDEETELRRYVLEKLSTEEKELLRVSHWEVYNKLADRSMLKDEED